MDKICCIVDFQGFNFDSDFYVREFAWVNVDSGKTGVNRFNLRPYSTGWSPKDKSTAFFTENKLHGLSFCPGRGENTISLDLLDEKVTEAYNKCKNGDKNIVAYKGGGKLKQEVLERLKLPFKNMEEYGCPKYTELKKYHIPNSCGFHQKNLPCSISQVVAYKAWLLENMHELMQPNETVPDDADDGNACFIDSDEDKECNVYIPDSEYY